MANLEIKVNLRTLEKKEQELSALAAAVGQRRLQTSLSEAKGATADQVTAVISELNDIAQAFSQLVTQTKNAVGGIRVGFSETDTELAQWFGIVEE